MMSLGGLNLLDSLNEVYLRTERFKFVEWYPLADRKKSIWSVTSENLFHSLQNKHHF